MDDTDRVGLSQLVKAAADVAGQTELDTLLRTTVELARQATGSKYAAMGVLGEHDTLKDFIHVGLEPGAAEKIGHLPVGHGVLGTLIRHPETVRVDDISKHPDSVGFPEHHPPMATFLGVPVRAGGSVFGNLYLTEKPTGYTEDDEILVEALAAVAGSAISSLALRQRLSDLALAEDRERIARDLHDAVIQDLFAVGLGLQATSMHIDDDGVRIRLDDAVDRIDTAIASLRTFIFDLRSLGSLKSTIGDTLRDMVGRIVLGRVEGWSVHLSDDVGEVDSHILDNALLIVREAVSNAVRHGRPSHITVSLERTEDGAELVVSDDGSGFDQKTAKRGMGMANMRARAADGGGTFSVESSPAGTRIQARLRARPA